LKEKLCPSDNQTARGNQFMQTDQPTPKMNKILKKVLFKRLHPTLEETQIFNKSSFGFRQQNSAIKHAQIITERMMKA
jgi:hypothetical protein